MSSSSVSRSDRPFDVIVWGCTGFTGKLVAEYIAGHTGRSSGKGFPRLKWALGGRDSKKVAAIKSGLKLDASIVEEPAIIVADADSPNELQKMCAQTRVVLSTVGPFSKYGDPLVAACVKTGTDYCDTTGESPWAKQMIEQHSEAAAKSGALMVSFCGFDSIPSDLGAYLAADYLRTKTHQSIRKIHGYMIVKSLGPSGGTIASVMHNAEQGTAAGRMNDRYMLNPKEWKPKVPRAGEASQKMPVFDTTINKWTVPFVMAPVNQVVVRRSLALRRSLERETDGFGEAMYTESQVMPSALYAWGTWFGLFVTMLLLITAPTRNLLKRFLPKPGEGPSAEQRAKAKFNMRVIAEGEEGDKAEARISGGDPGYTETALMVSEIAMLIALERATLPIQELTRGKSAVTGLVGGFYTPSLVGGHRLAERLREGGLSVEVGEFGSTGKRQ